MPLPGNEELSPQLERQQQFSNFSGAIPIKKRRFPMIGSPSPSPEKITCSEDTETKDKNDSNSPYGGMPMGTSKDMGHPGKDEENKSFESIVKKEHVTDTNLELAQDNVDTSSLRPQEANQGDVLENKHKISLNEKYADPEDLGSSVVGKILNEKQEMVGGKFEGAIQLEFSTPTNVGLLLGANRPSIPALEQKIREDMGQISGKSDLSSLSFALSREGLVSHDSDNRSVSDVSSLACVNRSNWDLNTTMDVWEGSVGNEAYVHKAAGFDGFSKINVGHGVKASLSTSLVVGTNLNKGNQVLDEHSSNSSNTNVKRSQLYKPNDILSLSLSTPCKGLDLCAEYSSLSDNKGSESVNSKVNLGRLPLPNMNLTVTNVGNVKSEPIDENSKLDSSIGSSSNMVLSKLASVKKECFENHSTESIIPQKSVGHKSVKSELVLEGNKESCESEGAMLSQSVSQNGKVMQHQDSSASSSALSIPLTPQRSCPSFLTCLELPIVGGLLNQPEHSFPLKEVLGHRRIPDGRSDDLVSKSVSQNDEQLRLCKTEELSVHDADNSSLAPVIEHSNELCGNSEVAANNEEKINISAEMLEEITFGSDCKSYGNHTSVHCTDIGEKMHDKEDDDYEDGEVREPLKDSVVEEARVMEANSENVILVECDCKNNDQNTNTPLYHGKATITENNDEICNEIKEGAMCFGELKSVDKILQNPPSDNLKEVDTVGKKSIGIVTQEEPPDLLGVKDVIEGTEKEVAKATNESHSMRVTLDGDATDKVVDICPVNHNSTSSEMKVSTDGKDGVKDSNSAATKSRIINLSRASVVRTPCKTRSPSSIFLTTQTGKERYSNLDGDRRPRWNRGEHGQSFRNSRHGFMLAKGRESGRFGRLHNEWNSEHDYASETYNGRADYRVFRHKQSSSIDDELEFNDCGVTPDGTSLSSGRKKTMNDELPSLRRPSFRRLSPGDIDGQMTRNIQMPRRFPRNNSPSRYTVEDGSDFVGLRNEEKFMRHLSDDIIDPAFPRQQTRYDEPDRQLARNRNFSAAHRKGYPRIYSKSPVRSRTRSPGPWSSPRQRSPNGHPDKTQQRSPVLYRMGRTGSPEHASSRNEVVPRRRVSPSYITQHMNDLKDFEFSREHVHPRPINSDRRSPPRQLFSRSAGRADVLDSRERADGDEYLNRPGQPDRFQKLCNDGSIDERRNFNERRGFVRPLRSSYDTDNGNYHLHLNDGPKPCRFYQDTTTEFFERNNLREREFDGHIKHPSVSRRMRDIEEQQDGSHRPGGRVWNDDGFSDVSRVKRRRF